MTLDMWITVFSLGVGVYAFWPKRKARANRYVQSELQPRHTLPHAPRRRRRQPVPLPVLAQSIAREVSACKTLLVQAWHAAREGWQEGKYPYRYMSSEKREHSPVLLPQIIDVQPQYHEPRTANHVPEASAPGDEPADTDAPAYKIPEKRLEALSLLFDKGLTPREVAAIQNGDHDAIRAALTNDIRAGVLASAMGGTRADRLHEIKQVAEGKED